MPPRWLEVMNRSSGVSARAVVDDLVGEVGPSDGLVALPPAADERLAAGVLAPDRLDPALGAAPSSWTRRKLTPRGRCSLEHGTDLAVLLVALALPAAVQAERDAGRGHPEPEAGGAGATDEDPRGVEVGAVGGVLPRVLLERERRRLEVEPRLGRETLDEAVGDVVGLTAQLAGEIRGAVLALRAGVPGRGRNSAASSAASTHTSMALGAMPTKASVSLNHQRMREA